MELLTQGLVGPIKPQISRGWLYTSIYAVLESMCKDTRRIKKMAEWNTFMDLYASIWTAGDSHLSHDLGGRHR